MSRNALNKLFFRLYECLKFQIGRNVKVGFFYLCQNRLNGIDYTFLFCQNNYTDSFCVANI